DRAPAAQRQPGGHADHGLLADADVDEARAEQRRQRTDGGAVLGGHDHDLGPLERQRGEGVGVGVHGGTAHRTTSAGEGSPGGAPWSSRTRASTSSGVKLANQRSARASMLGTPLPRTVAATIAVGRSGAAGRLAKARSRSSKSWPSAARALQPNAASLAPSGSSGVSSSVGALAWQPLRAVTA